MSVQQVNVPQADTLKNVRPKIVFQELSDSGINFTVSTLWEGFEVKLGDNPNGFDAEAAFARWSDVERWITETATKLYPFSRFARTPR